MNLVLRYGLILLALYLPANSVYAATVHKSLAVNDLFEPLTFETNLTNNGNATYIFSGSNADYINYVQLCMATDSTCSSCGAPYATYKMLTSNNGVPYGTVGTARNIQASAIQNYLNHNGYGDGTYYIGLYVQSQDFVCNYNHTNSLYQSYCSTSKDSAGHVLCMQAVSNGGTTTLTREDNGIAVLSSNTTPYLFINSTFVAASGQNPSIPDRTSVCPAYATPFACTAGNNSGSTPTSPYGIAVDPPAKNVYVISRGNAANSLSCSISSTDGGLTCSTLSFASAIRPSPSTTCTAQGIAIDPPGLNAYVTCGNNVYKCALGGSSCSAITLSGATLSNPMGIVIDPTNTYMYIANTGGSDVIACTIGGSCAALATSGNGTSYVTMDSTGTILYATEGNGSTAHYCRVSGTSLTSCSGASVSPGHPKGIVLNPSGTTAYAVSQSGGGAIVSGATIPGSQSMTGLTNTSSSGITATMQGVAWGNVVGP